MTFFLKNGKKKRAYIGTDNRCKKSGSLEQRKSLLRALSKNDLTCIPMMCKCLTEVKTDNILVDVGVP